MNDPRGLPDILTIDEVAEYLRVSKTTVCRWCQSRKIPAFRIGRSWRVLRSDLEHYIKQAVIGLEAHTGNLLADHD